MTARDGDQANEAIDGPEVELERTRRLLLALAEQRWRAERERMNELLRESAVRPENQ